MKLPRAFALVLNKGNQQDSTAWTVHAQFYGETMQEAASLAENHAHNLRRAYTTTDVTVRVGEFTHSVKVPEVVVELIPLGKR